MSLSSSVTGAALQILTIFMQAFAYVVELIIYGFALIAYGILQFITGIAIDAGPFSLPVFAILITAAIVMGQTAMAVAKDIPILEAIA